MVNGQHILGLDLGTARVKAAQGVVEAESGQLTMLGFASADAAGMRRGTISDLESAVSSVSEVLEELAQLIGQEADAVAVTIGGSHVQGTLSRGTVVVSRPDGEITESDVSRALEAARAISLPANREVLHVLPRTFIVDNQPGVADPLGLVGVRLEVEALLVHASSPIVQAVMRLCGQLALGSPALVAAPIASAEAVLSLRQRELGCVVIDLGSGTTGVAIYEENGPVHVAVVPIGGAHITNDLAIGLRTSVDTAERVKRLHGRALWDLNSQHSEVIDLSKVDPLENGRVDRRELVKIIQARAEEIFDRVRQELVSSNRFGKLPAGAILVGGGSQMPFIAELAKQKLSMPVNLGGFSGKNTWSVQTDDLSLSAAVGTVEFVFKGGGLQRRRFLNWIRNERALRLKRWLQSFLP